jgi:hypothetical protein
MLGNSGRTYRPLSLDAGTIARARPLSLDAGTIARARPLSLDAGTIARARPLSLDAGTIARARPLSLEAGTIARSRIIAGQPFLVASTSSDASRSQIPSVKVNRPVEALRFLAMRPDPNLTKPLPFQKVSPTTVSCEENCAVSFQRWGS